MAGVVESVKAAADVAMPVGGEIVEVNEELRDDPSMANRTRWATAGSSRCASPMTELDQLMDVPSTTRC